MPEPSLVAQQIAALPAQWLLVWLSGRTCPACGWGKHPYKSFCGRCYLRLPKPLQQPLYRWGLPRYEDAMREALVWFGEHPQKIWNCDLKVWEVWNIAAQAKIDWDGSQEAQAAAEVEP